MAKKNGSLLYRCTNCEHSQSSWLGRCPECGQWNTFEEVIVDKNSQSRAGQGSVLAQKIKPVPLSDVQAKENFRLLTGIEEFDRVLGNGAAKRSAVLLGGEPGIGKSTLLIQMAAAMANAHSVLYVSGEESAAQIKERADRLCLDTRGIEVLCTMRLEDILDALGSLNPEMVIVDSIQTVYSVEAGIVPGSISQAKYCANELVGWVKNKESVLIMTAHVTKEGTIAGPKNLEHMVDTVISFERNSDDVRFLHAQKNRFGSVDELGIFNMTEKGLVPVMNPATMFITERKESQSPGVCCTAVFEGNRVFMVEIQALTVPAKAAVSRVFSEKIDSARVSRIAAILEKRCGMRFLGQDIYVNVAGGIRLSESAIDGALAMAIYSARSDIPVPQGTAVFGELSLAGELRSVPKIRQRAKTAEGLGFFNLYAADAENGITEIKDIRSLVKNVLK